MSRYSRHIVLEEIGPEGQQKISNAKVLVVGAGGLGCPALQYLVAAGIGTLGIIDFDVVEESNLQRQILFGSSSLGKNKALAAKARLEDLNEQITIIAYPESLTNKNALALFESYDLVLDGSDNFATRYLINDAALITNKPLVYGAIYKFEGQVAVFNYKLGPSYRCLFPNAPKAGSVANCSEVGVLGVLPGIIGSMMANEVLKIILGLDGVLSGKLLFYDAKTSQSHTIKISRLDAAINSVLANKDGFELFDYKAFCGDKVDQLTINEAVHLEQVTFIDVRESGEAPKISAPYCLHIPLGELDQRLDEIKALKNKVLFCQTGVRSKIAIKQLQEQNITNCYDLKGGATALLRHLELISR